MTETVRVAIAAGITVTVFVLLAMSARDDRLGFGAQVGAAAIFGLLVAGLVLLWGWALA